MSCEKTLNTVQQKWKDVTVNDFTKENVFEFINEQIKYIDESQKLNFKRWDVLNKILQYEAVARGSYEEEIKHLKEYIEERFMVFGNMLLNANTSSFEVQAQKGWQGGGWNPGDWGGDWGDWEWPTNRNGSEWPWTNPGDGNDWPWTNPGDDNEWPWTNPGDDNVLPWNDGNDLFGDNNEDSDNP